MESRNELLRAAAIIFARHGYQGSTTRRIADEAGVNEITIFRQFGTKEALIHAAIACSGVGGPVPELPETPLDPYNELLDWATAARAHIDSTRSLMRRCMNEREEHPQLIASAKRGPTRAAADLQSYLERLRDHGFATASFDSKAAAAMMFGALIADVMGRDTMPDIYPVPANTGVMHYTTLLLRGIGVEITTQSLNSMPDQQ